MPAEFAAGGFAQQLLLAVQMPCLHGQRSAAVHKIQLMLGEARKNL